MDSAQADNPIKHTEHVNLAPLFKEMVERQQENHDIALVNNCVRAFNTLLWHNVNREQPTKFRDTTEAINIDEIPPYEDLDHLDWREKTRLARAPNTPITYLLKFSHDPDGRVRLALAENPNCPPELFLKLAKDEDCRVKTSLYNHQQNLPEEILEILLREGRRIFEVGLAIAQDEKTPAYILRKLIDTVEPKIREAIAENHSTPFDVLIDIGEKDQSRNVKQTLGRYNPNTPISVLRKLDREKPVFEEALVLIAQDPRMPSQALRRLAHESFEKVRIESAKHPNTPSETLKKLAEDPCRQVVEAVIENPNTEISTLLSLASDETDVELLILNPKIRPYVSEKVAENLGDEYAELLHDESIYMLFARICFKHANKNMGILLARNLETPRDILEKLAVSSDPQIRAAIADNQNTSPDVLEFLSIDNTPDVRSAVAGNSSTDPTHLITLAEDPDPEVRACAGTNQKTPTIIIEKLITDENQDVRFSIASSTNTPVFLLLRLANDKDVETRIAVMENEKFPRKNLKRYFRDPILKIRQVARNIFDASLNRPNELSVDDLDKGIPKHDS